MSTVKISSACPVSPAKQDSTTVVNGTGYSGKETVKSHNSEGQKEYRSNFRYFVSFMAFSVIFLMNIQRMNMNVAIIAMVNSSDANQTQRSPHLFRNLTIETLDVHEQKTKEYESKFTWSPEIQGYILSSSFFGYFLSSAVSGRLAENFGPKMMIIAGKLVASVCHTITPFAADFHVYFLIFIQFVRGLGQGLLLNSICVLLANWLPLQQKGLLTSFVFSGFCAGNLVGGSLTGILCDLPLTGGWPSVFFIFGILGVLMAISFFFFVHDMPANDPRISGTELRYILENQEVVLTSKRPPVPWRKITSSVPVYALVFAMFGQAWFLTHFQVVHATFLATVLNLPMTQNGIFTSVPYLPQMVVIITAGCMSTWINQKGYLNVDKVRKLCNSLGCFGYSLGLAVIIFAKSEKTILIASTAAIAVSGLGYTGSSIVPGDMSPTFSGTLMGISSTTSMSACFILPVVAGTLTNNAQTAEQWNKFFLTSIIIVMSSGIFFIIFGSAKLQDWDSSTSESSKNPEGKKK